MLTSLPFLHAIWAGMAGYFIIDELFETGS
jgi:hypothetical protein